MWMVDKRTAEKTRIPAPEYEILTNIDCSATSDMLLLTTRGNGKSEIWTMRLDGTEQRKVMEEDREIRCARWSPTGDSIYYLRDEDDTQSLLKLRILGASTKTVVLASGLEVGDSFTVSADGSRLAYTRDQRYSNLWLIKFPLQGRPAERLQKQLTSGTQLCDFPAISPDGHWIAFMVASGGKYNLFKMPIEGGTRVRLTFFDCSIPSTPAWSPDGRHIGFICDRGGTPKIWIVPAEGGPVRHRLSKGGSS
jgi:TolB protein